MKHPNELDQQISNLRTLQQSYDQIAGAAEAYNTGKVQLAENITAKGIPASATETLPELAEKVGIIAQTQTILEGGEVMAAQQFGDGALWNLYQVLADMKTRFMGNGDYAALIVCEYYKGYDSLVLQGADGYYTCDGDYYDYASLTHVWHDAENSKANRWVAFLYRSEGARLDITNTAISPRSMYIGGHIGTIEYFVAGRLTELVCGVEETDCVDNFLNKNFNQEWGRNLTLNNVKHVDTLLLPTAMSGNVIINRVEEISNNSAVYAINAQADCVLISGLKNINLGLGKCFILCESNLRELIIDDLEIYENVDLGLVRSKLSGFSTFQRLSLKSLKQMKGSIFDDYGPYISKSLISIIIGPMETNVRIKGWNPTNVLADATKKAQLIENIKNHILARVSDATGGTQLVLTVSTNMYDNIASEQIEWQGEMMSLADAFLTKNWLLAGA